MGGGRRSIWKQHSVHRSRVMRKPAFCICENHDTDQFRSTRIVQSLYFINPKFQASSDLLWLYSPVCVRPGRKPRRPDFSQRGSYKKVKNTRRSETGTTVTELNFCPQYVPCKHNVRYLWKMKSSKRGTTASLNEPKLIHVHQCLSGWDMILLCYNVP